MPKAWSQGTQKSMKSVRTEFSRTTGPNFFSYQFGHKAIVSDEAWYQYVSLSSDSGILGRIAISRHSLLQFFKPVQDDVDFVGACGYRRVGLGFLHHQETLAARADSHGVPSPGVAATFMLRRRVLGVVSTRNSIEAARRICSP
jgi:hypothetical protein